MQKQVNLLIGKQSAALDQSFKNVNIHFLICPFSLDKEGAVFIPHAHDINFRLAPRFEVVAPPATK